MRNNKAPTKQLAIRNGAKVIVQENWCVLSATEIVY